MPRAGFRRHGPVEGEVEARCRSTVGFKQGDNWNAICSALPTASWWDWSDRHDAFLRYVAGDTMPCNKNSLEDECLVAESLSSQG